MAVSRTLPRPSTMSIGSPDGTTAGGVSQPIESTADAVTMTDAASHFNRTSRPVEDLNDDPDDDRDEQREEFRHVTRSPPAWTAGQ
jgi:hypothetical protein